MYSEWMVVSTLDFGMNSFARSIAAKHQKNEKGSGGASYRQGRA